MNNWQPMETAPKDRRVQLYYDSPPIPGVDVIGGEWQIDHYSRRPKPYWKHDMYRLVGVTRTREIQPSMWQPLPDPPEVPHE